MKKLFLMVFVLSLAGAAMAQRTPPKHKRPPHPHHTRGGLPKPPERPQRPPSPKEVWQKMKQDKRRADAKRKQDMKEMGIKDPHAK